MAPEVYRKSKNLALKEKGRTSGQNEENNSSIAKKFSGILKIKDPRIIEEIAESDLLE
jgi:hypothetical protein